MENDLNNSLQILRSGGILLYPTDTVWGIGCDATNAAAVEKVIVLKQRPENKSFVVLASEKMLLEYVASLDLAVFDFLENLQKPTTVIYENVLGIAENAVAVDGSAAIRICNEPFCKTLLQRFKKPILSSSANISGEPAPRIFKEVSEEIKSGADYVVKYRQEDEIIAAPSSIVKWKDGEVEVVRK